MPALPLHREMIEAQSHAMSILYNRDPRAVSLASKFAVPLCVDVCAKQSDLFSRNEPAELMHFDLETDDRGRILREVGRLSFGPDSMDKHYDWYYDQEDGGMTLERHVAGVKRDPITSQLHMWPEGSVINIADAHERFVIRTDTESEETRIELHNVHMVDGLEFMYNEAGQLTRVVRSEEVILYEYDELGRVVRITQPAKLVFGGKPRHSVTSFTYSADGREVTYAGEFLEGSVRYDDRMRPVQVREVKGPKDFNQTTLEVRAAYAA